MPIRVGLGLSRSLSYGFMAQWRQQESRLKPAGCPIQGKGGDRLREASGKFQPSPCKCFTFHQSYFLPSSLLPFHGTVLPTGYRFSSIIFRRTLLLSSECGCDANRNGKLPPASSARREKVADTSGMAISGRQAVQPSRIVSSLLLSRAASRNVSFSVTASQLRRFVLASRHIPSFF
jgi:hypothetical protein